MPTVLDEVIEKAATLSDVEKLKLIESLQTSSHQKTNKKGFVHPNTIWIKEHHAEYAGNYVALKDGELIAVGKTIKEAHTRSKEKGVENPMLTYLFPLDKIPFGGW